MCPVPCASDRGYYAALATALVAAEQSGVPLDDPALAPARARLDQHLGGARRRDGALAMLTKASVAR